MNIWNWFIDNLYSNCFTLITVVLSGLISWIISAVYYYKGNRTNLQMSVILPIKNLLDERYTRDNYRSLCELCKEYSVKYLKESEREVLVVLCGAYKDISTYDADSVNANILLSYFETTLKRNSINFEPVPIMIDDEIVDYEPPEGYFALSDDLVRVLRNLDPNYQPNECQEAVNNIFNHYCKELYSVDNIKFFNEMLLVDVLSKSEEHSRWREKFRTMKSAKEAFLALKLTKNISK